MNVPARAADGAVHDVDLPPVEGLFERIAPPELAVAAVAPAGPHGGVADEEQRRERRVAGLGQVEPAPESGGVGTGPRAGPVVARPRRGSGGAVRTVRPAPERQRMSDWSRSPFRPETTSSALSFAPSSLVWV